MITADKITQIFCAVEWLQLEDRCNAAGRSTTERNRNKRNKRKRWSSKNHQTRLNGRVATKEGRRANFYFSVIACEIFQNKNENIKSFMAIRHDFCHDSAKSMQASLALAAPKVPRPFSP